MSRPRALGLICLAILAVGVVALRLFIDRDPITGEVSLQWAGPQWLDLRLGAAFAGAALGAALAISGALLQAALQNPLASPSLLGVASGAGLGVMVVLWGAHACAMTAATGLLMTGAFVGALLALLIVLRLGTRGGWPDPVTTILAGVIVSTMAMAGIVLLQGLVPEGLRGRFLAWAMGTVPDLPSRGLLIALGALTVLLLLACICWSGWLDALGLGDVAATNIGAHPGAVRTACLVGAGLLTACCVALGGPMAFVGLVAPHVARLLVGPMHRFLVPGAALAGLILVVGADSLRQMIDLGTGRLPVGVLTTLIGGPVFLILLRREVHRAQG
ncbi:MAG: iron ABC transporter permease [Phycisphaerales bacterium]|nr:iron ABC transporter permease [Phycisphaerales bacterium]